MFKVNYFKTKSSDGVHELNCKIYIPEEKPKGIFQVVHGMTEYLERYDRFMSDIADVGFVVVAHDHLGHGKTANGKDELGFISHKNGYKLLVEDVKKVADTVKEQFTDCPHILFGHSMGSFVVRLYASYYPEELGKLIIMGTGAKAVGTDVGIALTSLLASVYGEKHISNFVYALSFGSYLKGFEGNSPYRWLSKDTETIEKYKKDAYCNFRFTVSAMKDLMKLNKYSNSEECFKKTSSNLPILILSGSEDPVGDHSKGVKHVKSDFDKYGKTSFLKLYDGGRHEILNDETYNAVLKDVFDFIL